MNRRRFLTVAPVLASTPFGLSGDAHAEQTAPSLSSKELQRSDWEIEYTLDIKPDGTATNHLTVSGQDSPEFLRLGRAISGFQGVLEGESALEGSDGEFRWYPDEAETVGFEVELGNYDGGGGVFFTEVYDDAILSRLSEFVVPTSWDGGFDALPQIHRVTIDPPEGWTTTFSGEQVGERTYEINPRIPPDQYPGEVVVCGDFNVHTEVVGGTELRAVALPVTDGLEPEAALELWAESLPYSEYYYQNAAYPKLGVILPADEHRRGGRGFEHSFVITDNVEPVSVSDRSISHPLLELNRTMQRHDEPRWYLNGAAYWIQRLVLWEMGRISEDELYENLRIAGTEGGLEVGDPYELPASESRWKALVVLAVLDMDLRARTQGEHDFANLMELTHNPIHGGSVDVERETMIQALVELTGVDYTPFFEQYVDGSEYPHIVLTDEFSISQPTTYEFGPALAYLDVDVVPTELLEGESIVTTATIENIGDESAEFAVPFTVDGNEVSDQTVDLAGGASTTLEFEHTFDVPGTHNLAIGHYQIEPITVDAKEPMFEILDASLDPSSIEVGEQVTVAVTLTNTGTRDGETTLELLIDGETATSETASLEVGEETTTTFNRTFDTAGEFEIAVNDIGVGTVIVGDESTTPPDEDGIPGPGIVGTVGSILGAGYVLKWWTDKRRKEED